jgi:hypothetical protein
MYKRSSLNKMSILELLGLYSDVLDELCVRKILRSVNNPAADYAEYLVAKALNLTLAAKSTKGYDAIDEHGIKYEVKARRLTHRSHPTRFGAIRKLEESHFDYLVVVLFDEDFLVNRSSILSKAYVTKKAFWQSLVNGSILRIGEDLWSSKDAEDITNKLREVQKSIAV